MPMWNTDEMMKDLSLIKNVNKVENNGPGGDWNTDRIIIYLQGTQERLFASGFDLGDNLPNGIIGSRTQTQVPFVELQDGTDSRGGLQSTDPIVSIAYIEVRQYFINRGFEVVSSMDDYF